MKVLGKLFLLTVCFLNIGAVNAERYLLNSGDVLDISVWNEPELQKQVVILPDGTISFPLAGEVMAKDQTVVNVQSELKTKLSEYLANPVVTVSVASVDGNRIHILGKVSTPGSFKMSKPLDAIQALSLAGGLSPYAEENKIVVLRRENGKQKVLPVHYADIKKGQQLDTNIILKSGDVLLIP
jgi:polysaccharide export outer membrane protein